MAASSTPVSETAGQKPFTFAEWFGLRRHPLPDFFDTLVELPLSLRSLAEGALPPGCTVRGALFVPAEYRLRSVFGWDYIPDRGLVFLDGAALYVRAATPDSPGEAVLLDARSLLYARSNLLLLYGLLEMRADCGAQSGEVRLEYNTVIWEALRKPLGHFIAEASPFAAGDEAAVRAANAQLLKPLPFKFANGLRYYTLEPGERLRAAVFQPAIWERRALFPSQVTPNTLFALTEGKFVIIEEKRSTIWLRKPSQGEYGWIFTYVPRDRVVDMNVTSKERRVELRVAMEWGAAKDSRSFMLEPAVAEQWMSAWRESD